MVRCKTATGSRGAGDVAGIADASTACAGAQEALAEVAAALAKRLQGIAATLHEALADLARMLARGEAKVRRNRAM